MIRASDFREHLISLLIQMAGLQFLSKVTWSDATKPLQSRKQNAEHFTMKSGFKLGWTGRIRAVRSCLPYRCSRLVKGCHLCVDRASPYYRCHPHLHYFSLRESYYIRFYGCITGCQQLISLKHSCVLTHRPVDEKSRHSVTGASSQGLKSLNPDGCWAVFSSGGLTGEEFISRLIQDVGRMQFFLSVGSQPHFLPGCKPRATLPSEGQPTPFAM